MKTRVVEPAKTYLGIWVALLVLLLLTWGLARLNLGPFNVVAALAIAITKMSLVILFFMHVRHDTRLTWLFVAAGFIWLVIMIDLTLADYLSRSPSKEPSATVPAEMTEHRQP
jgi:cytochrome c oxidase subunit 4